MLREYLSNLANQFRTYLDTTEPINAQDFAGKIEDVAVKFNQSGFASGQEVGIEQGKLELLRDSEYMNAKVSGTAISVNDVSPIEHSVECTLTSDTITDFSNVEVSRYGKNLFDIDTVLPSFINDYGEAGKWIKQSDGSYFKRNVGTGYGDIWFENMANYKGQMTMSVTSKYKRTDVGGYGLGLVIEYTDGTKYSLMTPITLEYSVTVVVTNANKTVSNIWQTYDSGEGMYVKDIMIAYGSDTTYEPFILPTTYQSTADGTVKGVTSISPNMTLLSNNNGVVINANYLRDIDTYINNLITNVALTGGE